MIHLHLQDKTKEVLKAIGVFLASVLFIIGIMSVGVVIGQAEGAASIRHEEQKLILSYQETIQAKDDLITELAKATASTAQAAAAADTKSTQVAASAAKTAKSAQVVMQKHQQKLKRDKKILEKLH